MNSLVRGAIIGVARVKSNNSRIKLLNGPPKTSRTYALYVVFTFGSFSGTWYATTLSRVLCSYLRPCTRTHTTYPLKRTLPSCV
jgi:hypothetical protein